MPDTLTAATWDVRLDERDWARHLAEQTAAGLRATPPATPPVWFYDQAGSALFERITTLPEYYLTRAERAILRHHSRQITELAAATSIVELGAGALDKTRILLAAAQRHGTLAQYVPVDCSLPALHSGVRRLQPDFPQLAVHGVVADFTAAFPLPGDGRRLVVFLGSTIGNFDPDARRRFLRSVASQLRPGDTFLLGTDLVKSPARLLAAYNDAAGVTAAFNRNALRVMNQHLGADFDPGAYDHDAVWNARSRHIEMRLVARSDQRVTFAGLGGRQVRLGRGQWLRTEISTKFAAGQVIGELRAAGLVPAGQWSDLRGDFLVTLAAAP